ncbi:FecR family protein [Bradyrhizobium cenepequi]|uniref:FecR family protein n=1 Tax=Bradyrhizobium cenepequi TaxID=2821403 RepID=UPI001CE37E3B|nr:FecR domain-containing protein [Bradyrhizobium cenepequi]MCA6108690.1 FecR domain-containing protein [Bradyrhizobium cenepequi]
MVEKGQSGDVESGGGAASSEELQREALDWLRRLTSGEVTSTDIEALDRWRAQSRAHRRAFARANLLWDVLEPVAREGGKRRPQTVLPSRPLGRRAFLTGTAAAAAAAGLAYVAIQPPLHLWPAISELTADYRTATGERREVSLASGVTVEMNTRTSLAARGADRAHRVELISGQVAVDVRGDASSPVIVAAADGQALADHAHFDIRRDDSSVCVTCSEGTVQVTCRSFAAVLGSGQQVRYDAQSLGPVVAVDSNIVTSWQRGLLLFRDVPLTQVVEEVNRYRPGKLVLLNDDLGRRKVVAGFRIDQIDDVVAYVSRTFGARTRSLPGGIVLLS